MAKNQFSEFRFIDGIEHQKLAVLINREIRVVNKYRKTVSRQYYEQDPILDPRHWYRQTKKKKRNESISASMRENDLTAKSGLWV